jgi:hypothetical protein
MKTSLRIWAGLWRGHRLKGILTKSAALGCLAIATNQASAQSWTTTTAPIANWVSMASSADGNKLAALVQGGEVVYTSTNAGATWTLSSPANGGVQGDSIACSADGNILYIAGNTQIYHSTNSGASWNATGSPSESWTAITCSAYGTRLAATSAIRRGATAGIFTSQDEGATWTFTTAPSEPWTAIACSADGSKLAGADEFAESIYTSADVGSTWSQHSPPLHPFSSVALSANGTKLVAVSGVSGLANGPIFISTNSGSNWAQTAAPVTNWVTVASSADGRTLIAAGGGSSSLGHLYLSTDFGDTWNQTNVLLTHWSSVAISADGSKMVAAEFGGHIYTLHLSPFTQSPSLDLKVTGGNVLISWLVPSVNLVLQESTDLTSAKWADVTAAPAMNTVNLHYEVMVPNTGGPNFYRLTSGAGTVITGTQAIANVILGPWQTLVVDTLFTPTFNANGTFTATIQPSTGVITTDSGTWALTPPVVPSGFTNPQGHLTLTDNQDAVLLSGDVLLINPDQLLMSSATDGVTTTTFVPELVISKITP